MKQSMDGDSMTKSSQLKWYCERDDVTCENVHKMYDGSKKVATIRNTGKGLRRFEVQILDRVPWHRRSLKSAKGDCEAIYKYTTK